MTESLLLLIALVVLPILLLLGFTGCTGEDPILTAREEGKKEGIDIGKGIAEEEEKEEEAAETEAAKYENVILNEPGVTPPVPRVGLVSYWRLNELETGDVTAKDSAPDMPMNGEYKFPLGISRGEAGALSLIKDPNDKAPEFDGVQGFVEVPYHGLLNPPLDFSIEAWVRPEGSPTQPQVIVGSYEVDAAGKVVRGFVLDVLPGATLGVRARLGGGAGFAVVQASLGDGSQHGGWRHVVATYNGGAKALKLYVNADDGKADAELPSPSVPAPVPFADNKISALRIAAGQVELPAVAPGVAGFFKGRIDEVALYRVTLDGAEVRRHFLAAITA